MTRKMQYNVLAYYLAIGLLSDFLIDIAFGKMNYDLCNHISV